VATPRGARRLDGPPRPFRIGTPGVDLFPVRVWSRLASRRLRSVTAGQLDYGDSAGLRGLREAIAEHVKTARGTQCDADQVLVVAGAQQGLDLICRLLLDPGDPVWMEDPGYPGARSALEGAGARILPVRVDPDGLDVEAGVRTAGNARLAYVTPSHQYPLGVPMSLPRRLALLKWATAARAWVVEDDYDSEFRYGARPIPCLHGLDVDGRVIYVGSFSKTLFPALRLGFVIVPPDLQDRVVAARSAADQHPPWLEQAVLPTSSPRAISPATCAACAPPTGSGWRPSPAPPTATVAAASGYGPSRPASTRWPTSTAPTRPRYPVRQPPAAWKPPPCRPTTWAAPGRPTASCWASARSAPTRQPEAWSASPPRSPQPPTRDGPVTMPKGMGAGGAGSRSRRGASRCLRPRG
jgi:Aminotransferase class I and II